MYPNQQSSQPDHQRRHSFNNNNKVLVGGDNGKIHNEHNNTNLIQINSDSQKKEIHSAPVVPPMVNPFEVMPPMLKNFNLPRPPSFRKSFDNSEENSNNSAYEEDLRSRGLEKLIQEPRNPSPPFGSEDFTSDEPGWEHQQRYMNPRFPRNWAPRTNFRPQGFVPQQHWPRNGPRPPNRWMGPRPRFW